MDTGSANYLENNIGGVLAKALAEMSVNQPKDGVGFLAQWLKTHAEQEKAKTIKEAEERTLREEREKVQKMLAEKEQQRATRAKELEDLENMYQELLEKFSNSETTFEDSFWQDLVNVSQKAAGASAVYLGLQEEGEGEAGPYISYENASAGSEAMIERTLPKETGVTWGALTENPPEENFAAMHLWKPPSVEPVAPEPVEGEDPPPEKPTTPYYPVSIDCVTDVKEVHYFEMTRLGAYLAIPLYYPSYYTSDAYADAKQFEEEKAVEIKRREEEAAAAAAAAAEAAEAAEAAGEAPADAPPPEPVEEKVMVLRGKEMKMVLCLDTLGTNTAFEEQKVMKILELCKACGQCKSQTESRQVDAQALTAIDQALRAEQEEAIAACATQVEQDTAEALEAADAEAPEERKDLIQKKYAFLRAIRVAKEQFALIEQLRSWVVVVPEVLNLIAGAAFMCGYSKEEIYPRRKTVLAWPQLRKFIENPAMLLDKIEALEIEGAKKDIAPERKIKAVAAMATPPELELEKAKEIAPAFSLLFNVMQAAVAYRNADLEMRKAEWAKTKEEAGEEYAGPALEELDDDFVE